MQEYHLVVDELTGCVSLTLIIVARIAYLSSDAVISVQPSLAVDSEFSKFLYLYTKNGASAVVAQRVPEVCLTPIYHNLCRS